MIRHSEAARKTYRVRRYMMTAQVSWVQADTVTTERKDANETFFFFSGGYTVVGGK
jgi:hypothetical protein